MTLSVKRRTIAAIILSWPWVVEAVKYSSC